MDNNQAANHPHLLANFLAATLGTILVLMVSSPAMAQVRGKRPDRGTYQPPRLESVQLETLDDADAAQNRRSTTARPVVAPENDNAGNLRPVAYQDVDLVTPESTRIVSKNGRTLPAPIPRQDNRFVQYKEDGYEVYETSEIACGSEYACDAGYCDSYGCDIDGCDGLGCRSVFNSSFSRCRDQWFGSLELLMMHRSGDRLPQLVTTGPNEAGADSQTLFGGQTLLKDVTAGGRVTIGTWIDPQHCRSLVLRGWTATEQDYDFFSDQDQNPILGLPFRNVSDDVTAFDDVQIIALPDRATGNIQIDGSSMVFGGDLSVRQHWMGRCGGNVDLLYGYQYMRLNEDMTIASSSVSLDDDIAPEGSILATTDSFDIDNEFHGGQFGIAGNYREACWSFNGLAKLGFGSIRRRAELAGQTFTSIDGNNAVDPQGLHVRDTNSGTRTDNAFGWVPELDFTLGYHKFPNYELSIGYHIIAMTDALQVSGALDPNLASNLSDPALGSQNPVADFDYGTFYVQGIHFGIQYVH